MFRILWCGALLLGMHSPSLAQELSFDVDKPFNFAAPDIGIGSSLAVLNADNGVSLAQTGSLLSGKGSDKIEATGSEEGEKTALGCGEGTGDSLVAKIATLIKKPSITPRSFILPVTMIGVGSLCLVSEDMRKANDFTKRTIYRDGYEHKLNIDNYTMVAPIIAVYALNLAGIKGQHNLFDRTMILTMSSVICNGLVFSTKHLVGAARPDNSDRLSFPSGHTAYAFATAEFMRQEYRNVSAWYGAAGYACAIGTGLLRMYHDKHWLNDVVTGAGVGIVSTRISYWLYPKIKKALSSKTGGNTFIAPTYSNGAAGISTVYQFR